MGIISKDVEHYFLKEHSNLKDMLKPFLFCFDVTYAEEKNLKNTCIYVFLIKPEEYVKEGFGFDKEIIVCYSPFEELQPRALQAANCLFETIEFKTRADSLNLFIISKDSIVNDYSGITAFDEFQTRVIIPLDYNELKQNKSNSWYIRNILKDHCYDVDLFGYTLPLKDESSFFGRRDIISRYIDAVKRCENKGIFGVRKTGKTSLLFQIKRIIEQQKIGHCYFLDCKSPLYRKLHWNELLLDMNKMIADDINETVKESTSETQIIKQFRALIKEASKRGLKIIFIFDEIEYISFYAKMNIHWQTEFLDFWQTMWSIQSESRNLVFIVSGVNASITEIDTINGIQNPLFGIIQSEYLNGLSFDDANQMIKKLGRRMGMKFDHNSIKALYKQYNGHPMLLRMACSTIYRQLETKARPININNKTIEDMQDSINNILSYYYAHIVSEIKQFYPDEYEMLELLASGQTSDFIELSQNADYTKHLYSYGLIANDEHSIPYIKLPVAGRYVASEYAKKENRTSLFKLIEPDNRNSWVNNKTETIVQEIRRFENILIRDSRPMLFGTNSFPEADKFTSLSPVATNKDFDYFTNVCNRCFVESIDNYGKLLGDKNYFWTTVKDNYPVLFDVLHRIRVYRHSNDHLTLTQDVAEKYEEYWKEDTYGVTNTKDQKFAVQQKILDLMLTALQVEISAIS